MSRSLRILLVTAIASAAACDPCSGIVARIEGLGSGESYRVPAGCIVTEPVTVPAGASVEQGTFELEHGESITLAPSPDAAHPTTLSGATVRGGNDAAPIVVARGAGDVAIRSSSFELVRGIAIGISGARAWIDEVSITGNLDPARALEVPSPPDPAALATYGVAVIEGANVTATSLAVRRVAIAGLSCTRSTLVVMGGTLEQNLGIGLWAQECDATLGDVEIARTLAAPLRPGMGIAARASTIGATGLHLHDAPGYGLLAAGSDVSLGAPRIERLEQAGVWVEDRSTLVVGGGTFEDNRGAAIAAVGAERLEVFDATIARTALAPIPTGTGTSLERMGDGIHVVQLAGVASAVELGDLLLTRNERVGVVLDGAMSPLLFSVVRTRVETAGSELGAIAQNVASLPAGWDAEVTRVGSAATLDATAAPLIVSEGGLAGILMPPTITF